MNDTRSPRRIRRIRFGYVVAFATNLSTPRRTLRSPLRSEARVAASSRRQPAGAIAVVVIHVVDVAHRLWQVQTLSASDGGSIPLGRPRFTAYYES